jgi:hypothetical protein
MHEALEQLQALERKFPVHALFELALVPAICEALLADWGDLLQAGQLIDAQVEVCHQALTFEVQSTQLTVLLFVLLSGELIGLLNSQLAFNSASGDTRNE